MSLHADIDSALKEQRVFEPSDEFRSKAHVKSLAEYQRLYKEAEEQPEEFWANIARELHWFKTWERVLDGKLPFAQWFVGGQLNISYNCLDRHAATWRKNKAAILWEGEPGDSRTLTYQQLLHEVSKCANVLKSLGVKKGDRVAIYMGHGPRTFHRAAGMCPNRRATHRSIRRIFVAGVDRSHQRLRSVGRDYAGCQLPARRGSEAEGGRGSRDAAMSHSEERAGLSPHGRRGHHGTWPR